MFWSRDILIEIPGAVGVVSISTIESDWNVQT